LFAFTILIRWSGGEPPLQPPAKVLCGRDRRVNQLSILA